MKKEVSTFLSQLRAAAWTLLLAAAVLLVGATSCSDDESAPDNNVGTDDKDNTELSTSALDVITDPASMPIQVFNYAASSASSRSGEDDPFDGILEKDDNGNLHMPPAPNPNFDKLDTYNYDDYYNNKLNEETAVKSDYVGAFPCGGKTVYVAPGATWTITNCANVPSDKHSVIYVLPSATLKFKDNSLQGNDVIIYNYGTLAANDNTQQCTLTGITVCSATAINIDHLNLNGNLWTDGAIIADDVEFICSSKAYVNCKIEATTKVTFNCNSDIYVGYVSAPTIEFKSSGDVKLRDGGYIEATQKLMIENTGDCIISADEGDVAMIKASEIK